MKKAAITLTVLFILSLCLMISAGALIGGTAKEVSFTQENVVGDPASAEGFSVQSLFTLEGHAHWDTTLTLGEKPTWNTDFCYTTISKVESYPLERFALLYPITDFGIHSYSTLNLSEIPELRPYASVLREMAQEAPANAEEYAKTVALSDITDYFPIGLNTDADTLLFPFSFGASSDDNGFLAQYFHIPTEGYMVRLSVDTDASKNLIGASLTVQDAPIISATGYVTEDALYLAFGAEIAIPGSAPSGLYRFPITEYRGSSILEPDEAEMVLPLESNVIDLCTVGNEGTLFLLTVNPESGSQGIWIDADTGEVLYTFQEAADYSGSTVFLEGNHVIILSQPNEEAIPRRASVWEKDSDGQFEKTIDADISQATFSDCRSIRALYDEVQNRLLIAAFQNTYVSPSLQVAVCQEKAMTYAATFISSQDKLRKTTFFQAADEFPRLHLIQTQ